MRKCHLLAALGAWATLGLVNVGSVSVIAQAPNLLPGTEEGTVISDEVVSQDTSYRENAAPINAKHINAERSAVMPAPGYAAAAQFGGYPYSHAWHAGYQHPLYGRPLALVVPPVSHYQTNYGWGIGTTQMTPIYPQYDGPGYGTPYGDTNGQYMLPPYWPCDTRQFGVYYIRGPW